MCHLQILAMIDRGLLSYLARIAQLLQVCFCIIPLRMNGPGLPGELVR